MTDGALGRSRLKPQYLCFMVELKHRAAAPQRIGSSAAHVQNDQWPGDTIDATLMPLPLTAVRLVPLLGLVVLTSVTPAAADEQRLFALFNEVVTQNPTRPVAHLLEATIVDGRVVSVVTRATVPGWIIAQQFDGPDASLAVTAGGRFVVWRQFDHVGAAERLALFDRVTGQVTLIGAALTAGVGVSDPTRPRLFAYYQNQIARVSAEAVVILPNTEGLLARAISQDGRRLYAVRRAPPAYGFREFVVLDSTTGELLRTVPFPEAFYTVPEMVLADDESKAWLSVLSLTGEWGIRAIDLISGSEVLAMPGATGLLLDEVGHRVVTAVTSDVPGTGTTLGEIRIFDTRTGAEIERTAVESLSALYVDGGTRTILAVSHEEHVTRSSRSCGPPVLRALFPEPGREPLISPFDSSTCFAVAFASPTRAPLFNTPVVSADRSVSLSWSGPPELTNGFVVEAGSAPGLADLASFSLDAGTTVTVPNVPSGSYYVRVRARNYIGLSVASNEARIDVP
jgi:hypothetical protein